MSGQNFYVQELNVSVNATLATLHGGNDTTSFTADATAQLNIPVSYARHLFQYQADAIDVDDLNQSDVQFRMFHATSAVGDISATNDVIKFFNSKNVLPAEAKVTSGAIEFYGDASQSVDSQKVNADFVRYVGNAVFGVPVTDLFSNELTVRRNLEKSAAAEFVNVIQNLVNYKVRYLGEPTDSHVRMRNDTDTLAVTATSEDINKANNFPSRLIFSQLLKNTPTRFVDSNNYDGVSMLHLYKVNGDVVADADAMDAAGETLWRYMPLAVGDKIYFKLIVTPLADQEDLTKVAGSGNITAHVYKIQLTLVADNNSDLDIDLVNQTSGDYKWKWTNAGYDNTSNSEIPYLATP